MDAGSHERARQADHGLVTPAGVAALTMSFPAGQHRHGTCRGCSWNIGRRVALMPPGWEAAMLEATL